MSPHPSAWWRWLDGAAGWVWPRSCYICAGPVADETSAGSVCPACRFELFRASGPCCPRCSSSVGPFTDPASGCPRCHGKSFAFAAAVRLGVYDGRLRDAVLHMKSAAGEPLAETLGRLWADARRDELLGDGADAIVPVPLHWRRRWERGYNQSEAVCRGLASGLRLPVRPGWLRRTRKTPLQTAETAAGRWANVAGAFRAGTPAKGVRVLLVDDVLTTGATADAAATALRAAGVAQVRVAVLAHR